MIVDKYEQYRPDVDFMKRYMDAINPATGSEVDSNANVELKNIATMAPEIHKKANIFANRLAMHDKITKMFGKDLADEYLRQLEAHEIYRHDESGTPVGTPYCCSITLYPFLLNGLAEIGGTSDAPKNLDSFCGGFINLVFAVSAQFAGAVATPEWIPYMTYFLSREYGRDFYEHSNQVIDLSARGKTIMDVIVAKFQQVVYSLNQPAAARGSQSVFWNISYFDENYFKGMFEGFIFPDGTEMTDLWEAVKWMQETFMRWFNKERTKKVLTFPVESFSLLNDGEKFLDEESASLVAEMYGEGHSFFTYTSDSVDSLASCCFSPDTKIAAKSSEGVHFITLEELHDIKWTNKKNLTVLHNGSWVRAKTIKLPAREMYHIETANKKFFEATDNHLWPTLDGLKRSDELTEDDYLLFNTRSLNSVPEKDRKLTYEQGILIGMYLGDGSISKSNDKYCSICYSLNEEKYISCISLMNKGLKDCQIDATFSLGKEEHHMYPVRLGGSALPAFIDEYVRIGRANEKRLNPDVLLQSLEFRKGILDGMYATDGGNSNRIYSASRQLAEDLELLCTSLGLSTVIDVSDRTDEAVVIRGQEWKRNYPLYCVRWYTPQNKRSMDGVYKVVNNSIYFKVKSVQVYAPEYDSVYCFERYEQEEPYFTLPCGVITHNCRLRNEVNENTFSYSLGAGGIATGSKCVMTININRLVQNATRDHKNISEAVKEQVEKIHKYLTAFNEIIYDYMEKDMLPIYKAKYVTPEKQYLTVGINGLNEGAEFLGIKISDNEDYQKYVESILKPIYDLNKQDRTANIMWNMELVPAENLGVKNAAWDKKDGYMVNRDCYNSYFYLPEDDALNPVDKFVLHGRKYTKYCDGGSALHCNLSEHLSKAQYEHLMKTAIKTGCPYFTFNIPNTVCKDCGHISKHYLSKCPKCGSDNVDYATRVIGFLKLVSKFSLQRQKEESNRYYADPTQV